MYLFFEGYQYSRSIVKEFISDNYFTPLKDGNIVKIDYAGYFYNSEKSAPVFILPKVFCTGDLAFGIQGLKPEAVVDWNKNIDRVTLEGWNKNLLYELPIWIYRAISTYKEKYKNSDICATDDYLNVLKSGEDKESSLMDIILSLVELYKKDKNYFIYIYKQRNSGLHHINWRKTVAKKRPLIQDDEVIYMDFFTKKKEINFDEQLLVLFLSTIRYISYSYGFHIVMDSPYHLLSRYEYEQLLKDDKGLKQLRRMKNDYFSDTMVEIWRKLNVWFSVAHEVGSKSEYQDFVLAKNFNIIFEDMIDELIGDDRSELPKGLREQKDGKVIDHLFKYSSLVLNDDIYYIGDSKYYKESDKGQFYIGDESVYKQYTYAKNVIQFNLDVLNNRQEGEELKYRDELTEGYNITPNFFITGNVKAGDKFETSRFELDKASSDRTDFISYHFINRLFDRDTLLLKLYNINFLFALYTYASKSRALQAIFKTEAQKMFKKDIQHGLIEKYAFYHLSPDSDAISFVNENFKMLNGKILSFGKDNTFLLLALEKTGVTAYDSMLERCSVTTMDDSALVLDETKNENVELARKTHIARENKAIIEKFGNIMVPYIYKDDREINFSDPSQYEDVNQYSVENKKDEITYQHLPEEYGRNAAEEEI